MAATTERVSYFQKKRFKDNRDGILFILPAAVSFILFLGIPMLITIGLMFVNYNLFNPPSFVGLNNFQRLRIDPLFMRTLGNTLRYFLFITPIQCVFSLLIAYLVSQVKNSKMRSLYRGLIFFPTFVTTAAVAIAWTFIFATDTGFVNFFIRQMGGSNVPWMTHPTMIYVTIALFSAWKFIGTSFLYYFIGLQNIPSTYHEAAMIDGAGKIKTFFKVTLPLLTPTVFFVFVVNMIGILQIFEEPFFIAPGNTRAMSFAVLIYENAFVNLRFGYAGLLSVVMFLIIMTVTAVQFWGQRKWVNYDYE